MGYTRGNDVLPEALLAEVQKYIDGAYVYIPRREDNRKPWGENTNSRQTTLVRNQAIDEAYRRGASARELARRYCLSVKSIHKILAARRRSR